MGRMCMVGYKTGNATLYRPSVSLLNIAIKKYCMFV